MTCSALRQARIAAGLTYREVSSEVALDPSSLAHCEAGRARPSQRTLERWEAALRRLMEQRRAAIEVHLTGLAVESSSGIVSAG